jgi:hypothetical protein
MGKIFGYTWESIQARQQGTYKAEALPREIVKPVATEEDIDMLKSKGLAWIETQGFYGIIDRLKTSELI